MTIRRRTKSSSRAARAKRPIPVNQTTIAPLKRVKPPLVEQFRHADPHAACRNEGTGRIGYGRLLAGASSERDVSRMVVLP